MLHMNLTPLMGSLGLSDECEGLESEVDSAVLTGVFIEVPLPEIPNCTCTLRGI
jgi:hypothetical protein